MRPCSKIPYSSQQSAEYALKHVRVSCRRRGRKVPTGTYWCSECRTWHLTFKSPSRPAPWQTARHTGRPSGKAATANP